jgi:5-methyltetrahydrofolate--homocysteine methyltransferase
MGEPMINLHELMTAIIEGQAPRTRELVQAAIAQGVPPEEIVTKWMIPAMAEVGARFDRQEYFVPEMLVSARAMKSGLALVQPLLSQQALKPLGTVVIGTVKGDLHDIGKNLVAMMLEGAGFQVVDLGVDVGADRFVDAVRNHGADIVGLSALLTTTMIEMKAILRALKEAGVRTRVKVLVGGAPVTGRFAGEIGADGYGETAAAAVKAARDVLGLGPAAQMSREGQR